VVLAVVLERDSAWVDDDDDDDGMPYDFGYDCCIPPTYLPDIWDGDVIAVPPTQDSARRFGQR